MNKYFYPLIENPFSNDDINEGKSFKIKTINTFNKNKKIWNDFTTKFNSK